MQASHNFPAISALFSARHGARRLVLLAALLGVFLGATPAWAQWRGPPQGMPYGPGPAGPLHEGFWIRVNAGLAYASTTESVAGVELDATGLGYSFGAQIGAAVRPDIILHFDLAATGVRSPNLSISGGSNYGLATTLGDSAGDVSQVFFGAGATKYFGDMFFFSAALGGAATQLGVTETGLGYGVNLLAGMEGEIRRRSFLGGALQLLFTTVPHTGDMSGEAWIHTLTFGFVLTSGYR